MKIIIKNKNGTNGGVHLVDRSASTAINTVKINEAKPAEGIPVGTIIMYKGSISSLPSDWKFCDGTGGTPNLRDRFVLGYKRGGKGVIGGKTENYLEKHSHTFGTKGVTNAAGKHLHSIDFGNVYSSYDPDHSHTVYKSKAQSVAAASNGHNNVLLNSDSGDGHWMDPWVENHTHTITIPNTTPSVIEQHKHTISCSTTPAPRGKDTNSPPFYTLAFIMKVR